MRFRFLIAIMLCFAAFIPLFSQNWQFDRSPTRQNLARLDLVSDSLGWAVSYDGLILKYDGTEWTVSDSINQIKSPFYSLTDSLMTPPEKMGDIYTIRVIDPARGWLAVNNVSQRFYMLVPFNPIERKYSARVLPLKIRSIDFSENQNGIAAGEGGAYYFKDGKWDRLTLPLSVDFRAVKFTSNNTIFICGEKGTLIKGTGNRWEVIETPVNETLRDLDFISENEGWITGSGGTIIHYKDGELIQEIAESTQDLWAVEMITADSGFAAGQNGTILKYNGDFWDLVDFKSDIDFHDIEIISEKTGFIVGARGAIVKLSLSPDQQNRQHQFLFEDQVHLGSSNLMGRIDDVYGITAADFNGDQLPDLYFTCYRNLNHLLINSGGGYYIDKVIESGTGGNIETRIGKQKYEYGSLAADFDRDGDTDIFLAGKNKTTRYLANNGKAVFEDLTELSGLPEYLEIIDGALGDFNNDGYPDAALADVNKGLRIIVNKKYNNFEELNLDSLKLPLTGIRAVKTADINNDHQQDILVVYYHKQPVFLINSGELAWEISGQNLISGKISEYINSITFSDFNMDGRQDFYLCTEDGRDGIYIFNPAAQKFVNQADSWKLRSGGRSYSASAGDFNLDGFQDLYVSRYSQDLLYLNQGDFSFKEAGAELIYSKSGYLSGYNTGAAAGDIDSNGSIDLVIGNSDFWSSILQNRLSGGTLLKIKLNTVQDSKEALGAKIWLWESGIENSEENLFAYHEVLPSNGLFSQNWHAPILGLGSVEKVDVKVRFLNGEEFFFSGIKSGQVLEVNQASWLTAQAYKFSRAFMQFLNIPNMMWEILKFLLFLALILISVRFIEIRYRWRPAHAVLYVLIIISINVLFTVFMENSGVFYHILPFTMLVFVLMVLTAVNEPIRRAGLIRDFKQEKMREAGLLLSRSPKIEEAFKIAAGTLKIIQPYKYLLFYTYHNFGNFFLLKGSEGSLPEAAKNKFALSRDKVQELLKLKQPMDFQQFSKMYTGLPEEFKDCSFFVLTRKKEVLGLTAVNFETDSQENYSHNVETIKYLLLQLSIALDNIRILQNLQEQENIAAIGSFASGIIHNLKNPIDGLRMIIEMLNKQTADNDPNKEYVSELYKGVLELKERLIHSFDFISDQDKLEEIFSINDIIKNILKSYDRSDYSPFVLNMEDKVLRIKGGREQLTFAVENVIQNAVEASDLSKPVAVTLNSKNNNLAEIRITDKGTGIADENLDTIFNLFQSTRGRSRGLGLALTRNIIKKHNGWINVKSRPEEGTEFKIVLPLAEGIDV